MADIEYLSTEDVIALHNAILARMNDPFAPVVRRGELDSAVNRCRNAAWYEDATLARQAVILAIGVSQCQAFLEGNKRAGFVAADVFLKINGLVFQGPPLEMARWIEKVAEVERGVQRDAEVDRFVVWLRSQIAADDTFRA